MSYVKQTFWLAGIAAAITLGGSLPAQADGCDVRKTADSPDGIKVAEVTTDTAVQTIVKETVQPSSSPLVPAVESTAVEATETEVVETPVADEAKLLIEPTATVSEPSAIVVNTTDFQSIPSTESFQAPTYDEGVDVAQVTRGSYGSVSPAYLGIGGNLGIGDADSAVGDFGFAVVSKISLGPRFSVRPSFLLSERFSNFTVPITFNLNTMRLGGFRFQPYIGGGVDVPFNGNTAFLVNAGADVPISRDFTLNTNANWRVTSGFALGVTFGLGYNFPFIFE
jgi:hypothetical protein